MIPENSVKNSQQDYLNDNRVTYIGSNYNNISAKFSTE
jgi:hypothetical protein